MRNVYTNRAPLKKKANKLARHLETVFTEDKINELYTSVFNSVLTDQGEKNEVK
jgi:hypothetical protein